MWRKLILRNELGMEERPASYPCLLPRIMGDEIQVQLQGNL